jgi:hypothetical protein
MKNKNKSDEQEDASYSDAALLRGKLECLVCSVDFGVERAERGERGGGGGPRTAFNNSVLNQLSTTTMTNNASLEVHGTRALCQTLVFCVPCS